MEIRDMGPGDGPDGFEYEVNKEKRQRGLVSSKGSSPIGATTSQRTN